MLTLPYFNTVKTKFTHRHKIHTCSATTCSVWAYITEREATKREKLLMINEC